MRVTQNMLTQQFLYNLTNNSQRLQQLQNELSSGKVLNSPSDNPLAVSQDMAIRTTLQQTNSYQSTISSGLSWMKTTSSAVQTIISNLQTLQGNVLQGINATNQNPSALNGLAQTAQQLVNQVYSTLQTKAGNRYVFGGEQTQTDPSTYASTNTQAIQDAFDTPGAGTGSSGVSSSSPASPIASSLSDPNHLLQPGVQYSLKLNATSVASNGVVQAGTIQIVDPSGNTVANAAISSSTAPGATVTLSGTGSQKGQTLSLTLGKTFQLASGTTTGTYTQTDALTATNGTTSDLNLQVAPGVELPVNLRATSMLLTIPQGANQTLQSTLNDVVNNLNGLSKDAASIQSSSSSAAQLQTAQTDFQTRQANLQTDLANLTANTDNVTNLNAGLGARMQRLQALQQQMSQYSKTLSNQQSNLEDANMAQVITQFSTDQNVYQAALKMGAEVMLPSLISFLPNG